MIVGHFFPWVSSVGHLVTRVSSLINQSAKLMDGQMDGCRFFCLLQHAALIGQMMRATTERGNVLEGGISTKSTASAMLLANCVNPGWE